jgi:hypothetical protein
MAPFATSINKAVIFQLRNQLPNLPGHSPSCIYYSCGTHGPSDERARHRYREARRSALLTLLEHSRPRTLIRSRATRTKAPVRREAPLLGDYSRVTARALPITFAGSAIWKFDPPQRFRKLLQRPRSGTPGEEMKGSCEHKPPVQISTFFK